MLGSALVALIQRGDIALPLDTPETTSTASAEDHVGKLLQTTALHMEIVALVTMTVTYLYARFMKQASKGSSSLARGVGVPRKGKERTSGGDSVSSFTPMMPSGSGSSDDMNTPSLKQLTPRADNVPRYMKPKALQR